MTTTDLTTTDLKTTDRRRDRGIMEPINFLGAVRQRWRLIVVLAVVGAIVFLLLPTSTPKHVKSNLRWETYAIVGAPVSTGILAGSITASQILFFANTAPVKVNALGTVRLVGNPYVYAAGMFGTSTAPSTKGPYPLAAGAGGTPAPTGKAAAAASSGVVTLYASADTASLAAQLANAYAVALGNRLQAVATARAAERAAASPTPASRAATTTTTLPTSPTAQVANTTGYEIVFPGTPGAAKKVNLVKASTFASHKVRLVAGLLLGVVLSILLILLREVLNRTIRRPTRNEVHFKLPLIAEIPETYPPDPSVVDVVDRPASPAAEVYRKLRMSVLFEAIASDGASARGGDPFADMFGVPSAQIEPYRVPEPGSRSVVLVVSTMDEPSRPKVVANLAATYAEAGEHVVVVSTGDLEVGTTFPAESVLSGPVSAGDVQCRLAPAGPDNVSMLSMRHFMRNSGQLVSRSKDVLDAARMVSDVIIIEVPAFLKYHHGEAMVHSVDVVVVVSECGVTTAHDARDAGDILRRLGAPVLGVVFTGEKLSSTQRKVLDAGTAASGRSRTASLAGPVEEEPPGITGREDDAEAGDAVADGAVELHPS
jgi:Mrp family chromosome partitioning ATPase